jgi:hypothetical protein
LFEGVRWFWGLTCDFRAENAKKKNSIAVMAVDSVASGAATSFTHHVIFISVILLPFVLCVAHDSRSVAQKTSATQLEL